MIHLSRTLPVNPPGAGVRLTASDVWRGLVMKADNALPFVPAIQHCEVLERVSRTVFVREIEFRGERMRERVVLEPERQVTFERLSGSVTGTITNTIVDEGGELGLRFSFDLALAAAAGDSGAEEAYARDMEGAYLGAVDATLGAIRKLVTEGRGAKAQPPAPRERG